MTHDIFPRRNDYHKLKRMIEKMNGEMDIGENVKQILRSSIKSKFGVEFRMDYTNGLHRSILLYLASLDHRKLLRCSNLSSSESIRLTGTNNYCFEDVVKLIRNYGIQLVDNCIEVFHVDYKTHVVYRTYRDSNGQLKSSMYFFGKNAYRELKRMYDIATGKYPDLVINSILQYDGELYTCNNQKQRKENTVIVTDDKRKKIWDYLDTAVHLSDHLYKTNGVNLTPGILFYGAPGTGKSTMVGQIAERYNCDIIYINVNTMRAKNYNDLLYTLEESYMIGKRNLLVFEDIDIVSTNRRRVTNLSTNELVEMSPQERMRLGSDTARKESILYDLLQLLDGANSVPGTIKVATTNYIDRIDSAIIRPGRFDLKIEMEGFDETLAKRMCDSFHVSHQILTDLNVTYPINPAQLQSIIIENYTKYSISTIF